MRRVPPRRGAPAGMLPPATLPMRGAAPLPWCLQKIRTVELDGKVIKLQIVSGVR